MVCRSRSRLLLSESSDDAATACPGGGDQIVDGIQQSSLGLLVIQNVTLCAAGANQIIYDIGYLDPLGDFVPIVLSAFSSDVLVTIGEAIGFRLEIREFVTERTYTSIKSLIAAVLHDQGRNVSPKHALKCSSAHQLLDAGGEWNCFLCFVSSQFRRIHCCTISFQHISSNQ